MIKEIKTSLDNYLEFDSDKLLKRTDYLVVFGGSLRDIVAGDEDKIKDIDIMCISKSRDIAIDILLSEGYIRHDLFSPDIFLLYTNIRCIFEPKTFVKGNRVVQLITPCNKNGNFRNVSDFSQMKNAFFNVLCNVDLSSSGLVYDGEKLYESVKNSKYHCENKIFMVLEDAEMYNNDRINFRINNLKNKNWKEIKNNDDIKFIRSQKILSLRNNIPTINDLKLKIKQKELRFR